MSSRKHIVCLTSLVETTKKKNAYQNTRIKGQAMIELDLHKGMKTASLNAFDLSIASQHCVLCDYEQTYDIRNCSFFFRVEYLH